MRTRAQASRDAALRRLTRVNRSLAIAAVVGTGVITDVVANTASGQARSTAKEASNAPAANKPELLVSGTSHSAARKAAAARHRAAAAVKRRAAVEPKRAQTSSATTPSVSAASSTAPVVAVSGGS
jgi:hypothetical protein